jgi:hypothetical protein
VTNRARLERELVRDGLEDLGTITLGTTLVAGDPAELAVAGPVPTSGVAGWHGVAVKPGAWRLFGRPTDDGEALTEVIFVHEQALPAFWDLYDDAAPVAAFLLPTGRVLVVDGARRSDASLLQAAAEPDDLPWLLDDGIVLQGLDQHPAHVWTPQSRPGGGPVASLVAVALDAAPAARATTSPFTSSDRDGDADRDGD